MMYIEIAVPRKDRPRLKKVDWWWMMDGGECLDFDYYKIDNICPGLPLVADLYSVLRDEDLKLVMFDSIINTASYQLSHEDFSHFVNHWDFTRTDWDWTIQYLRYHRLDDAGFSLKNIREMFKMMLAHKAQL